MILHADNLTTLDTGRLQ